jgi:Zn-dependent alcohol dehydrogenase
MHSDGRLPIDALVTQEFPLSKINQALDALRSGEVARALIRM